jgi:hypothetical protein
VAARGRPSNLSALCSKIDIDDRPGSARARERERETIRTSPAGAARGDARRPEQSDPGRKEAQRVHYSCAVCCSENQSRGGCRGPVPNIIHLKPSSQSGEPFGAHLHLGECAWQVAKGA